MKMKKLFMAFAAVLVMALAPFTTVQASSLELEKEELRLDILANYAEKQGWCEVRYGALKPGQIVVEWFRDAKGRCILQRARQG